MSQLNPESRRIFDAARYSRRKTCAIRLLGGACVECGAEGDLQFDHVRPEDKTFTITDKLAGAVWEALVVELEKCQLLCASCHRKKTLVDKGQVSAKTTHGTLSSYRYCKCDLCREVRNKYAREWRRRKRAKNKIP